MPVRSRRPVASCASQAPHTSSHICIWRAYHHSALCPRATPGFSNTPGTCRHTYTQLLSSFPIMPGCTSLIEGRKSFPSTIIRGRSPQAAPPTAGSWIGWWCGALTARSGRSPAAPGWVPAPTPTTSVRLRRSEGRFGAVPWDIRAGMASAHTALTQRHSRVP